MFLLSYFRKRRALRNLARDCMSDNSGIRLAAIAFRDALSPDDKKKIDRMTRDIWLNS